MANDQETKTLFVLLSFWFILILFTNIFSDYINGENIYSGDLNCLKVGGDCQSISNTNQINSNNLLGQSIKYVLDIATNIPIINYLVPILRIMTFTYSSSINVFVGLFLDMFAIITGIIIYSYIKIAS